MNPQLQLMLQQAIEAFQGGNFERAATILQRLIQVDPKNLPALHILGLIRASQANFKEAAHLLGRAARIHPNDASIQYNLAKVLSDIGSDNESIPHHKKAVELAPHNPEAWLNYGKTESNLGRHENALIHYDKALSLEPGFVQALSNKSATLRELRRFEDALACAEKALAISPDLAEAWSNKAVNLHELGYYEEAITHYDQAITLKPDDYAAWTNKGVTLKALKRYEEAITHFDQALALKPDYHEVLANKGAVLNDLKLYSQAMACYDKALSFNPEYHQGWLNKGITLKELNQPADARSAFKKAIELVPESNAAHWGKLFTSIPIISSSNESVQSLREVFISDLHKLDKWFCDDRLDGAHEVVGSTQPFYLAYQAQNNKDLLNLYGCICHRIMAHWQKVNMLERSIKKENTKIQIGIIGEQICNHSVWNAITKGLLLNLDTSKFEAHIFHLGTAVDNETLSARDKVKTFTDNQFSLLGLSKLILEKNLDILLYPEIGMHALTMQLACLRLAPIQIAAWGHPETTGLPTIDYYLSGELFESDFSQDAYTETLIKLPNLGCSYSRLSISPSVIDLEQFGISRHEPILICPGAPFKYAPKNDWIFVEIAKRLGKCKFIFFKDQNNLAEILKKRLNNVFQESNLALSDYIVFIPWLKSEQFYGVMKLADVFMDTIGFSGFNTAMQAIDCALPIVTQEGDFMRGRFASGILKRMKMPELIADSDQSYIELVIRLVQDKLYHSQIVNKMNEMKQVLYDDPEPIRALENFLLTAVKLSS
ncbi:tetratricopeptide repeat protein [Polynucleobacter sp. MWH-P3-07-1]|uniref:tetratricopeptide repeat protein n=1 Tax=Polynucleobacter sp. MWH-P3-07-1 TaxID=1743173 RepID=UPI001BFE2595|nr:glycosyltransferase family 41 protein [Polynucleobacter sp. MWH-P3-07-1]QWD83288.1 tetratricopeptide repeat protein [Polynucleobacter sp. MWH-P3-07-1]